MKLLFALGILMIFVRSACAGRKDIFEKQHSVGKLSAEKTQYETSHATSKNGNPLRSTIKEDLTKLKEEEDREASEKRIEEKEGYVDVGSGSGNKSISEPENNTLTVKHHRKSTSKKDIKVLLCKFMKLMARAKGSCRRNVKKAMIWPKKMLPVLEKMLMNKNSESEIERPPLTFADDGGGIGGLKNNPMSRPNGDGLDDNWDRVGGNSNLVTSHHKHHKRKMRRLLKMLRAMLNGRGTGGNWDDDSTNDSDGLNKGNTNVILLKHLLNQMLGRTDRSGVLKEMLEEFLNANGVDRNGEEAHEALNELMGRKSLFQLNNMLPGPSMDPEQNLGLASTIAQPQPMGMFQGGEQSQAVADGMIHAQMLSNGAIAPMSNPSALQQTSPVGQPMNTRLLGQGQGRGLLTNPALAGMMPRPVVAANQRMYMGVNEPTGNHNVFQERQMDNEELLRMKAAEERGIGENAGVEVLNDSPRRDSYFQPQSMRTGYSDSDLVAERTLGLQSSVRSPLQASRISSVTRPEIEDSLNSQPTIRSTSSRLEGSQFYANHNGLNAALENDSLLRNIGAFRRGKVLKGQKSTSTKEHTKVSPKTHTVKGLLKLKTFK